MTSSEKLYRSKKWLYAMYWEQGKSMFEMAKIAQCSRDTIRYWMNKYGIPCRSHSEAICLKFQDPEYRKNITEANRHKAQDPEYRKKQTEAIRHMTRTDKWRRAYLKGQARRSRDPEERKRHAEAMRHLWQDPDYRAKQAEARARLWANPEWRRKHLVALRETHRRLALKRRQQGEMTKPEEHCYGAFESLDLDFVFEKSIYPYWVDFFFPSHGVIVACYGDYWHTLPGKQEYDAHRKQYLEASGYTVLEWWEKDILADVYKLIDQELLPLLGQPSRMERPPRGVSKPYKGPHGWKSAVQLYLFGKEQED